MMQDLYHALPLPDDRPITSLCIVEEISRCPSNYTVVAKSHDQDIDADLCKDGFFRRVTRYLCHSKIEGHFDYVVETILITNDKDARPVGFTVLEQTLDTSQRAFRRKQLCYKAVPRNRASQTITDIIVLSRSKLAPEGFTLVGEMNGLSICFKPGPATATPGPHSQNPIANNPLPYGMNPNHFGSSSSLNTNGGGGVYPGLGNGIQRPSRQAPLPPGMMDRPYPGGYPPPAPASESSDAIYDTAHSSLSGVPFILNKKYVLSSQPSSAKETSSSSSKSRQQIEDEYYYSFALEQDIVHRDT